jgi:hypothetical protein
MYLCHANRYATVRPSATKGMVYGCSKSMLLMSLREERVGCILVHISYSVGLYKMSEEITGIIYGAMVGALRASLPNLAPQCQC